tara:strand:- start:7126 stop:7284 length:159 start_codon:yes stop_codon:yes gene_type:complete
MRYRDIATDRMTTHIVNEFGQGTDFQILEIHVNAQKKVVKKSANIACQALAK